MKKLYPKIVLLLFVLLSVCQIAQTQNFNDKGFSFQGYARNNDGAALSSSNIEVQFSIYQQGQAAEFTEVQTATTDAFGVFHLVIGSVNATDFKKLDFISKADYKLKVETRVLGGTYATISDAVMQSVPYAQSADNGVPVGTILIFAGPRANIPAGWLACDGASISSTIYPKLYAAIGTAWGNGSVNSFVGSPGNGDFNVPDLRGMFPRGVNEGSGRDPDAASRSAIFGSNGGNTGDNVGTKQFTQFQWHSHTASSGNESAHRHNYWDIYHSENSVNFPGITTSSVPGNVGSSGTDNDNVGGNVSRNSEPGSPHNHSITVDGNGGAESRPINVYVYYIIRAR